MMKMMMLMMMMTMMMFNAQQPMTLITAPFVEKNAPPIFFRPNNLRCIHVDKTRKLQSIDQKCFYVSI